MRSSLPAVTSFALLVLAASTAAQPRLLVSGFNSDTVHVFDLDGTLQGTLGPVPGAQSLRYGPDGDLYACAEKTDEVLRFDGGTGALIGPFVWDDPGTPQDDTGGLDAPTAAVFGPDGNLYVASFSDDAVLRYDGATGAYIDDFIPAGTGAINGPDAGMDFGPDGHLYIPSYNNHRVLRYDGKTGAPMGAFAPFDTSILTNPRALRWRGDGLLYVTSWGNNRVLRYDLDGNLVDIFATVVRPTGMAFSPDGHLFVTSDQTNRVFAFQGTSGAPLGELLAGTPLGVSGATYLELLPDPELRFDRPVPELAGAVNTFGVHNGTPGGLLLLAVGVTTTSLPIPCPNDFLGVASPLVVPVTADANGQVIISGFVDAAAQGATLVLQAFDPAGACLSNLVIATFD